MRKAYCPHIITFPSPRSQSASAVANGRLMYLISGYTALTTHRALPNMQAIGPHGLNEEEKIIIDGNKEQNYSSRLAAAVTLSSGGVLVTGGKGKEREVFLLSGPHLATWQRRADLLHPRMGHAALNLQMDGEEVVMVAGGWDGGGRTLSSVEIFLVGQNVWRDYVPMPSPRADFTLQVRPGHPQSKDLNNPWQVINGKVTAIGGLSSDDKFSPSADLTITSSQPLWTELDHGCHRAGFVSVKVPRRWIQEMCPNVYG